MPIVFCSWFIFFPARESFCCESARGDVPIDRPSWLCLIDSWGRAWPLLCFRVLVVYVVIGSWGCMRLLALFSRVCVPGRVLVLVPEVKKR